jgi:hypothetical protein
MRLTDMDNNPIGDHGETRMRETQRLEAEERRWLANAIVGALLRTGILCDVVQTDIPRKAGRLKPDTSADARYRHRRCPAP